MIIDFITTSINQFVLDLNAPLENLESILAFVIIFPIMLSVIFYVLTIPVCYLLVVPFLHVSSLRINREDTLWKKLLNVDYWGVNERADKFTWGGLVWNWIVFSIIYFALDGIKL